MNNYLSPIVCLTCYNVNLNYKYNKKCTCMGKKSNGRKRKITLNALCYETIFTTLSMFQMIYWKTSLVYNGNSKTATAHEYQGCRIFFLNFSGM